MVTKPLQLRSGDIANPQRDLTTALQLLDDGAGGVSNLRSVRTDGQDGVAQCGSSTSDNTPMAVCGWADRGSLAIVLFANRDVTSSAALFPQIRAAMEPKK